MVEAKLKAGAKLLAKLLERAPADLAYHAWRHTVATWLEDEGASEWERGLVLNHAGIRRHRPLLPGLRR